MNSLYSGGGVGAAIIDVGNANDYSRMDLLILSDGSIHLGARAPDSMTTQQIKTSVTHLTTGQWYHIVGVINYNANTGAIYINGVNDNATGTLSFPNRVTDNTACYATSLGCNEPNDEEWINGVIDDARFYSRVLSDTEIQTMYACRGNDSIFYGLQSRWLMNEGAKDQVIKDGDIAVLNVQSAGSGSSGSSITLAYTVPTGDNMILVVAATAEGSSSGNVIASSATFVGAGITSQASTRTTVFGNYCGVIIGTIAVTSGQSGNIVVNWSGSNSSRTVMAYVLTNVNSATAEAVASNYNNSGVTTQGLTTLNAGALVATACINEDGYVMTAVGTNHTRDTSLVAGSHAGAIGHVTTTTPGAISGIGFTASPTPGGEALVLAAFTPVPGQVRELSDFQYAATVTQWPTYDETFMKSRR